MPALPPRPIRRLFWRIGLYGSGLFRARNFGTFAVNSLAATRGRVLTTTTPITSQLFYGTVSRDGEMLIHFAWDHRVFDAYGAWQAIAELERVLNTEIVAELEGMSKASRAAAA